MTVTGYVRAASLAVRKRITSGSFDLVWELRNATGTSWLGTAYLDEETIGGDAIEGVLCLVLTHDEDTKSSEVLLLDSTDEANVFVRKGVAQILGFDVDEGFMDEKAIRTITLI